MSGTAGASLLGRGRGWVRSVAWVGLLPLLALPVRLVSTSSSSASLSAGGKVGAMPPSPAGHPGVYGGRSGGDRLASAMTVLLGLALPRWV